jgi:hypothetical protein
METIPAFSAAKKGREAKIARFQMAGRRNFR